MHSFNTKIISIVVLTEKITHKNGILYSNLDNSNIHDYLEKSLAEFNEESSYKNLKNVSYIILISFI